MTNSKVDTVVDHGEDLWLVNGAERPTLTVKATEWHRLRLVMAGVSSWLYLSFGTCEVGDGDGGYGGYGGCLMATVMGVQSGLEFQTPRKTSG